MFKKFIIPFDNAFERLSNGITFENICKGRQGAILVDKTSDNHVPIIRSTTIYKKPAMQFSQTIKELIQIIKQTIDIEFNNAMIEIYDNEYCTMGYHSDQALDIADNSYICIFSCYEKITDIKSTRTLSIKKKNSEENSEELLEMNNNSIIIFDNKTNSEWVHKIILENNNILSENKWLGITFRLSKTYVRFIGGVPYLNCNELIHEFNKEILKEYYLNRSLENKTTDFKWPSINYTISPSDIMPVI
jgi:hypothetical protein